MRHCSARPSCVCRPVRPTGCRGGIRACDPGRKYFARPHQRVLRRRCASDNAVEIAGIALQLRKRFGPASGASREVGVLRTRAVEGLNDLLAGVRGDVIAAVGKVFETSSGTPLSLTRRSSSHSTGGPCRSWRLRSPAPPPLPGRSVPSCPRCRRRPTALRTFHFQPESGSQYSEMTLETDVGLIDTRTRQTGTGMFPLKRPSSAPLTVENVP